MSGHNISWGKVLVGATVAAGAIAAIAFFPDTAATVGNALKDGVTAIFGGIGSVGGWIAEQTASLAKLITENKALAIGTAAAAGGLVATGTHLTGHAHQAATDMSFAMREDMRRMQGLMQARMAATGYAPAMAMAGQGR